jgi:hypothetical protein
LRSRASKALLCAAALGAFLSIGANYALSRWRYIPPEPLAISRHFVDLVQAGDLSDAYLLTTGGSDVGATLAEFDARIRQQLLIDVFPTDRPVKLIGIRSGSQSYGNRLRRWLSGRTLDPAPGEQFSVDYLVGLLFEVRLAFYEGKWIIVYFQSHAG